MLLADWVSFISQAESGMTGTMHTRETAYLMRDEGPTAHQGNLNTLCGLGASWRLCKG